MPVDLKEREKIYAGLIKKGFSIHSGSEVEDVYRIPFKSPNMNYATEGGAAIGRFNLLWGALSTFKSRVAYELIAQAQNLPEAAERALMPRINYFDDLGEVERASRLKEELDYLTATWPDGMECAFYNAEQQWDKAWAQKLGIDTDRVKIVESQTIEDIVGIMQATYAVTELHVVDSTSNASSIEEQKMEMSDRRMGLDARVWKQTLRKSMPQFNPEWNVGILINQASTNIRTGGTQAVSTRYIGHTSSMTIKFERGRFLYKQGGVLLPDKPDGADKISLAGRAEADGVEIFATVEKSRVCRPFRVAALHARYGAKQFDHIWELVNAAIYFGIAEKSGSWYKVADDEKAVQGLKKVYDRVEADDGLQRKIYGRLMQALEDDDDITPDDMDVERVGNEEEPVEQDEPVAA